ncbi:MAG: methylmalonyl-CoA mutase family protein [Acidimicrobiales bacterium]|nr:hypothetical protein [Acidimicrobiales bacterium]
MADNSAITDVQVTFERPLLETWVAAAEAALRGRSIDSLVVDGPDGTQIHPLYTREQHQRPTSLPGTGDHRRGATAAATRAGWDVRQQLDATSPEVNAQILQGLERGVTSIALVNCPADRSQLEAVLEGVYLDMAGVHLDGAHPTPMIELWRARDLGQMPIGSLGIDPIGRLAATGSLPSTLEAALHEMSEVAYEVGDMPMVVPVRVDGRPYGHAGAGAATEIACMLSTAVTYLRNLVDQGRSVDEAVHDLAFSMTVDADQFTSIAKLRAARVCWARIVEACGGHERGMRIHAQTSSSMITRVDPWVNMLRTTIGAFAAAVGGAKAITVTPFDAALGQPDDLGLRIARNIQLILAEESALASVIDAAGGSYYVENLTDQIAQRAWALFQQLEAGGGIAAALLDGRLQSDIAAARQRTEAKVARRKQAITGVTEFPDLAEQQLTRAPAAAGGDSSTGVVTCEPLGLFRPAETFEQLRSAAPAASVFSANLGSVAAHTARATFAANLFAVGGVATLATDGFDDNEAMAEAFVSSGASVAVICGSDAQYAESAAAAARALKDSGATYVYLAGSPGDNESAWRQAGIDEFVHLGVDVAEVLTRAHQVLAQGGAR